MITAPVWFSRGTIRVRPLIRGSSANDSSQARKNSVRTSKNV